jgi:Mitochondrial carrier protein
MTYGVLGLRTIRHFILPAYHPGDEILRDYTPLRLGLYTLAAMLSTIVLCPLEVMITKLAIQRNHASSQYNSVSQEIEGDAEETAVYSGTDEDVIGYLTCQFLLFRSLTKILFRLRHERDPYLGFMDCAKRIVDEEGFQALYRAWWITMIVCVATAFSA